MSGFQPISTLTHERLLALLAEGEFFSMRGWKGDVADFFAPTTEADPILRARRACLELAPSRYCGALETAAPPLEETAALARQWTPAAETESAGSASGLCRGLALALEPDFIILTRDRDGPFLAVAGAVCFPSSWDFESTLGKPLPHIHAAVPGLNETLGVRIDALLAKLPPGDSWSRFNWGISLSPARDQHPAHSLPRLADADRVDDAWLRVEIQVLHKLPATGAVLFGIRLVSIPFSELSTAPAAARTLSRQLDSMPPDLLDYKGIGPNAHLLDRWLR